MTKKITDLTELATAPETTDVIAIEDLSAGATKKITWANFIYNGCITSKKLTAHYYQANVAGSGTVTSATFANFPTNRCKVDVVTANANAIVRVKYSAEIAYAGATGSGYLRFTKSGANTGNSTYQRRAQNNASGQEMPVAYEEIITLASAGTTTIEMQIAGSAASSCSATSVMLIAEVLQDKG